jgi:hypothetical protein
MEVVVDKKILGTRNLGYINPASSAGSCFSVQVTFLTGILESWAMIIYDIWSFKGGLIL